MNTWNKKIGVGIFLGLVLLTWEVMAEQQRGGFPVLDNIWKTLLQVKWKKVHDKVLKEDIDIPQFTPEIKALNGKTITVSGYILPTDLYEGNFSVLSAYPMAQCFFCGGAGPESVMEVYVRNSRRNFATERVTFKGTLELNDSDSSHLIYKLKDAVVYFSED